MRFNLGKLTEDEEVELFRLSRSGKKRFTLEYYPKGYESDCSWGHKCSIETLCFTNDYNEVVQKIQQHYQSLLANDASLIANDETVAYYQITDVLNYNDEVQIQISELNRLSFMLQLCGYQPKKKTTKKATATKE